VGAGLYKSVGGERNRAGRRVLITGMGSVTPYGPGVDVFWDNLVAGKSAIGPLTAFDPTPYGTRVAGEVREFRAGDFMTARDANSSARCVQFAIAASKIALDEAKLSVDRSPDRIGVFFGTSVGTLSYAAENHAAFLEKGIRRVHPLFPAQSYVGVVATQIAIQYGVRGPAICVSTACTSSADAIGTAWLYIKAGIIDCAIVGGTEAPLGPFLFAAFDRLGVMSRLNETPETASRPFAETRDGFVMSEGAGACILEAEEAVSERDGQPLAELSGYAATSDAFHIFNPLPSGEEGVRAIRLALDAAESAPSEVDYVNAHAIGSKPSDPIELNVLGEVFEKSRARIPPISAVKSMLGHCMGAAGVLELIACVRAIRGSLLPPTINLDKVDDDRLNGFDLVPGKARKARVRVALSPTFGFGSRNAALVIREV
jgi:3-oxoacyl-[acyl-carrier-protein] synthase II